MLQVISLCDYETHNQTGAFHVVSVFLFVFVILLTVDAVLTWFALDKALTKDEREDALQKRIEEKELYLKSLQNKIKVVEQNAHRPTFLASSNSMVRARYLVGNPVLPR